MSIDTQAEQAVPASALKERRPLGDRVFQILALAAGLLVLAILVLIAFSTTQQASSWFTHEGLSGVFSAKWNPSTNKFGSLTFVYGTAVTSVIAIIIAVPLSLGIALLLTEVVSRRMAQPIVYVIDLLAVVPSVVWGLWGIIVLAPWLQKIYTSIGSGVKGIPVLGSLFGPPVSGASFFTAGLILAFMVTPIITSLSREVIATVPAIDREGAYALGATRWEMIRARLAAQPGRHRRRGPARPGPGHGRDDRGRAGHRLVAPDHLAPVRARLLDARGHRRTSSVRPPAMFRSALIGLGVLLFALTIIINVIARSW